MPGRNGTGPMGLGPMSGKGMGLCTGVNSAVNGVGFGFGSGRGMGCRRGFGRNSIATPTSTKTQKEMLTDQKEQLAAQLELVSKQLENL